MPNTAMMSLPQSSNSRARRNPKFSPPLTVRSDVSLRNIGGLLPQTLTHAPTKHNQIRSLSDNRARPSELAPSVVLGHTQHFGKKVKLVSASFSPSHGQLGTNK